MLRIFVAVLCLCLILPPAIAAPIVPAVEREAGNTVASVFNRVRAGIATAGDYQSAATALRILFAQWEEAGQNHALQLDLQNMANQPDSVFVADDNAVGRAYVQMTSMGAVLSREEVRDRLNSVSPIEAKAFAKRYARPGGIEEIESVMIQSLLTKSAQLNQQDGRIVKAAWACEFFGLVGIYSFIVALACPVCAPVAGIIGGITGIIAFIAC